LHGAARCREVPLAMAGHHAIACAARLVDDLCWIMLTAASCQFQT
jgi:hypothetical protein